MGKLSRSYVHGGSEKPLIGQTLGEYFDAAAQRWADCDALIVRQQNLRWTYRDLQQKVDAFAAGLLALGLQPGDRIGIWSPNNSRMGDHAIRNGQGRAHPRQHQPGLSPRRAGICAEQGRLQGADHGHGVQEQRLYRDAARTGAGDWRAAGRASCAPPGCRTCARDPHRRRRRRACSLSTMCRRWARDAERQKLRAICRELQFDDPINIQFTSGTTGFPKGATLTHHNILNNGYFIGETMRLTEKDRICIPVPLYHCFGMVLGNLACVTHGATMVYPGEAFDPAGGAGSRAGRTLHRRSTACRPCSSPSWTIRSSSASISPRCAPASWRARLARSRS